MNLIENWNIIRSHFSKSFSSSLHCSIASVDAENNPTISPIGTVFLNKDQTGFYFEQFTNKLPRNSQVNKQVCLLAVNSSKWFWIKSLYRERFDEHPAIRLYAQLGEKRAATEAEVRALRRRMRFTSRLKGHEYLWEDMQLVRDFTVVKAEQMHIGKMTIGLSNH